MAGRSVARWVDPYRGFGALLVLVAIGASLRQPWEGDFGVQAGAVERLRVDLLHPGNPMVAAAGPSPYYSPYTVGLGLLSHLTGWSGRTALAVAGPVAVVVALVGLWRFVTALTPRRFAPVLALAAVLLAWGPVPLAWSGFPSLYGLPLMAPYPSFVAIGLTLLLWAGLVRGLATPAPWWRLAGWGACGGAVALIHPFTAVVTGLGALAIAIHGARDRRSWVALLTAALVAGAVVAVWPYYRLTDLLGAEGFDDIHRALYTFAPRYFGLAVITVPALWLRWRRDRLDPLVLLCVASAAIVGVGGVTGHYALGRVWPGVLLAGQIALGIELAGLLRHRSPAPAAATPAAATPVPAAATTALPGAAATPVPAAATPVPTAAATPVLAAAATPVSAAAAGLTTTGARRAVAVVVAGVLALGLWVQAGNLLLAAPAALPRPRHLPVRVVSPGPDLAWVRARTVAGDVVLTDRTGWLQALPGYGLRTVVPAWPDPYLSDVDKRTADQATILDPRTTVDTRAALLTAWRVRWLLLPATGVTPDATWNVQLTATGPGGARLYEVGTGATVAR